MIQIGDKIVSRDLFQEHFACDLHRCMGNCCVYGDSGAPLEEEETELLEKHQAELTCYMRSGGIRAIKTQGPWVIDHDGERVTPLVDHEECAYAVFENGVARCSIEIAFSEGSIPFRKPVSCHLYPVRISKLNKAIALNYHRWSICEPARLLGKQRNVPVFRFLEDALTRVFGKSFYDELESVYREIKKEMTQSI